jgi:predicted transcriptional regulator
VAEIVSAYVSKNSVQRSDLASLINSVHGALTTATTAGSGEPASPEQTKVTAPQIRKSITPDFLISFEDGKRYKTLRRHLTLRGLTPQAYRDKWGLPIDYPMVAPSYAKQRSELAKALGLGQQRRQGLAKVSAADALKVEAFEEAAESPAGEVARDDEALAEAAAAPELAEPASKGKRTGPTRGRKRKAEPATT